jgi:hypothetical protein
VSCQTTQVDCNGTCVDPLTDTNHCGASGACGGDGGGSAGVACNTGQQCAGGICAITCPPGQVACGGNCIDPKTNNKNCGASPGCGVGDAGTAGQACATGQVCSLGSCQANCAPGYIVCSVAGVLTCVDPNSSPQFCGAKGACDPDAGTAGKACTGGTVCAGGTCGVSCLAGQVACNGVCINPQTDETYCGATSDCIGINAGHTCGGGQICQNGTCALTCTLQQVQCNGTCIDPTSNNVFCGAQLPSCTSFTTCEAGYDCEDASCTLSCQPGFTNCFGQCVNRLNNNIYCGSNTTACSDCQNGGGSCACEAGTVCNGSGQCKISCLSNEVLCNGTCVNGLTDNTYCGATGTSCGVSCASVVVGSTCQNGGCSCPGAGQPNGQIACDMGGAIPTCIDPRVTNRYCGSTGSSNADAGGVCPNGQDCTQFAAGSTCGGYNEGFSTCNCPPKNVVCSQTCIDPNANNKHCGATTNCANPGQDCTAIAGATCVSPQPVQDPSIATCQCPTGQVDCNFACIDPATNNTYCGAFKTCQNDGVGSPGHTCGVLTACSVLPGGDAGTCNDTCNPTTQLQCDSGAGAPYCANFTSDNSNCGACHNACGALTTCGADGGGAECFSTCPVSQSICPGVGSGPNPNSPYCADLTTDPNNCGSCNNQCTVDAGGTFCTNSGCSSVCQPPDTNCPGAKKPNPTTPYCANLSTDPHNCGSCAGDDAGALCPNGDSCLPTDQVPTAPGNCCGPGFNAYCTAGGCTNLNGDETTTGVPSCGTCGTACGAGQVCSNGKCGTFHWVSLSTTVFPPDWSFINGTSVTPICNGSQVGQAALAFPGATVGQFGWLISFEDVSGTHTGPPTWAPAPPAQSGGTWTAFECAFP